MVAGINLVQWEFYVFLILLIIGNTASMVIQQLGFQKGQAVGLVLNVYGTLVNSSCFSRCMVI